MEIKAEKILNAIFNEGDNGTNTLNAGGGLDLTSVDLASLAEAIRNTKNLDPKKLASLKTELLSLAKSEDIPMTVRMKMLPLAKALEGVEGGDPKILEVLKPYIGDAQNLSALAELLGKYGGKVLEILRKYFLPV